MVLIHHEGKFKREEEYIGETADMGRIDISTIELVGSVNSLGYHQVGSMWWSLDDDPVTEVKPWWGDKDIIEMQKKVYKECNKTLYIWLEHAMY